MITYLWVRNGLDFRHTDENVLLCIYDRTRKRDRFRIRSENDNLLRVLAPKGTGKQRLSLWVL